MISVRSFILRLLHDLNCPIGEATEPQGAGEADERTDTLIKTEEVGVEGAELGRECHAVLETELRRGLVTEIMAGNATPPLRPDGGGRVLGILRYRSGLFHDR